MKRIFKGLSLLALGLSLSLPISVKADELIEIPSSVSEIVEANETRDSIYLIDSSAIVDGLTGGVLALENNGLSIIIDTNNISEEEMELLNQAGNVIILGGPARVNETFENLPGFSHRVNGENRYETAVKVAESLGTERDIIIANGENLADALTSLSIAAEEDRNILLVKDGTLPESTKNYLETYGQGKDILFVGGVASITEEVADEIIGFSNPSNSLRISGENRSQTSLELAKRASKENVIFAHGDILGSAITASNFTDLYNGSVVLTYGETIEDDLVNFKNQVNPEAKAYFIKEAVEISLSSAEEVEVVEEVADELVVESEPVVEEVAVEPEPAVEEVVTEPEPLVEEVEPAKPNGNDIVEAAKTMIGFTYSQSARMSPGHADCSSLVLRSILQAGVTSDTRNLTTSTIWSDPRFVQIPRSQVQPGDILHSPGHVAIFVEGDTCIEAKTWGVPAGYGHYLSRFGSAFRVKGL